jgi:hypothetical protein
LARQGHGPQRHEGDVIDKMLRDRIQNGFDPMTGNTVDYDRFFNKYGEVYNKDIHGVPPDVKDIFVEGKGKLTINWKKIKHQSGEHATKFNTPTDYIRAYENVLLSPEFQLFKKSKKPFVKIENIKLTDIFGPNFQNRLSGYSNTSSANKKVSFSKTRFGNETKLIAIFTKGSNGNIQLKTMYPNP